MPTSRLSRAVPPLPHRETLAAMRGMLIDRPRFMADLARAHDAVRIPLLTLPLHYFTRPEHAQHVLTVNAANYEKGIGQAHARRVLGHGLLTSEGTAWRQARTTVSPLFARSRNAEVGGVVQQEAAELSRRLRATSCLDERDLSVRDLVTKYTIGVLGPALLQTDLTRYEGLGPAFDVVQNHALFEAMTLNKVPTWFPLPRNRQFRSAMQYLQSVVDDLIDRAATRSSAAMNADLVTLIQAEPGDPSTRRARVRDELMTMLLAGHETTASTLAWALYLVGQRPDVVERLRQEAAEVLDDELGSPGDVQPQLPYATAVVHETLRLYPAVWLLSRRAIQDDVVGGFQIPAGAQVLICPYALHRDPRCWDEPDTFIPDRFLGTFPATARYAYIPFGAGPRSCVGRSMGMIEATVALARVCRDFTFTVRGTPGTHNANLTLRPHVDHAMSISPRRPVTDMRNIRGERRP